jgi:hypothetical protein
MRRIKKMMQNLGLVLMDWGFGSEIRRGFDFLRSLCKGLNSLYTLFMKDFALTGRNSWVFEFFQSVVSSSIRDMLTRTNKKLIVDNFLVN